MGNPVKPQEAIAASAASAASAPSADTATRVGADATRDAFGDIIDRAVAGERFVVQRHAKDRIAIVGMDDYERFLELERRAERAEARRLAASAGVGGPARAGHLR